ncbi:MAG: hypothetical protein JSR45_10350 [Proteobacteria bacterium]|nr:hypothetical protein [Pseudomonadota bacterium]
MGRKALVVALALFVLVAACAEKPKPADAYAEAKAGLQKRLGPTTELHYVSTNIAHGKTAICGVAGPQISTAKVDPAEPPPPFTDHSFVFADGTLTLDSDEDAMAFERRVARDCPDFVSMRRPVSPAVNAASRP